MNQIQRDEKGRFLPGNTINAYTDEELETLLLRYCQHRAYGGDKESFRYCHYETVERYAARCWETSEELRKAEALHWYYWESIMRAAALGIPTEIPDRNQPGGKILFVHQKRNTALLLLILRSKLRSQYGSVKFTVLEKPYSLGPIQVIEPEDY